MSISDKHGPLSTIINHSQLSLCMNMVFFLPEATAATGHPGFTVILMIKKQGNRLTRRPCKGDEFEILIFEAKRQNAGICRSRQKMFATWTFISIGRRVTQE